MMKHVLMIAHSFPPEGHVGTFRTLRFVRKLPTFGWSAKIISIRPIQYERFDAGLLKSIPSDTEVIRVNGHDLWQKFQSWRSQHEKPGMERKNNGSAEKAKSNWGWRQQLREVISGLEASWYHPDMAMPWIANAVNASVELCKRVPIQVIWATAAPVSSLYIAQQSSIKTHLPYVLDFRDPWTITRSDFEAKRPAWATRRDRKRMYQLFETAQAVVFRHATEAECFWRAYKGALEAEKIHLIPNGFEGEIQHFIAPVEDKCTILYTGTLSSYRFSTLLEGVALLKQSEPSLTKYLCLRFVGEGSSLLAREADTRGISDIINARKPVSQSELSSLYKQSQAVLVFGREPHIKGYELLVGAKLFEYLRLGLPIVGVLPYDETRRVLEGVGVKTIADADSPPQIAELMRCILHRWSSGDLATLVPDRKSCEAYSSDRQTAALVRALEGIPAKEPFIPGSQEIPPSLQDIIGVHGWLGH